MSAVILVLEDDPDLNENITTALSDAGYAVLTAFSRAEAERLVRMHSIDLALCDVNLGAGDGESDAGFAFCGWLRARRAAAVCFLSARDLEEDLLTGYALGAADYVTKPFSMKVLLAKIAALLGRDAAQVSVVDDGWLRIDLALATVTRAGEEVRLSPTEWKLLRIFLDHRGQLLTYSVILDTLWEEGVEMAGKHALTVAVNRLRNKLEGKVNGGGRDSEEALPPTEHRYIANVYGMGYLWK